MAQRMGRTVICLLLTLMLLAGAADAFAEETHYSLPIDFSGGMPLQKDGFKGKWHYEDPTISVTITEDRYDAECDYWVADIKIADPSQLRTEVAVDIDSPNYKEGEKIAKRVNAVLAIDGDYFYLTRTETGEGFTLRQGELYWDNMSGRRDVLLIDEDGDFHVVHTPKTNQVGTTVNGKKVINAFFFGPILVENGKLSRNMPIYSFLVADKKRQRMCIAQVGPLEYKCICCGPPARGNSGMTLADFAKLVSRMGVETAYNMDGGDSCAMFFAGEKVNDVDNPDFRKLNDIIYFASAYGANQ